MKIAYLDCFSGISGDMLIGALIDAGLDFGLLEAELRKLPLPGCGLTARKVMRGGISATKFDVSSGEGHPHRRLGDILEIIDSSGLDRDVKQRARDVFMRLAEAEAAVHGTRPEDCEFHEIGAADSIMDIVGACAAAKILGIEKFFCSSINLGGGTVNTMHGTLPVPAPATARILEGAPVYSSGAKAELTTPTGAVLAASFARFGALPAMKILSTGYGAGDRDLEEPNVLRVILGDAEQGGDNADEVLLMETNIDDMNPEICEYVLERLFENGALDAYITPVIMKKSRPGFLLSVICPPASLDGLSRLLFRETTSSGLRYGPLRRSKLKREIRHVETPFGRIAVKLHSLSGGIVTVSPEYEDCKRAARESGTPLKNIYEYVRSEALRLVDVGRGE